MRGSAISRHRSQAQFTIRSTGDSSMKNDHQEVLTDRQLEEITGGLRASHTGGESLDDAGDRFRGNLSDDVVPEPDFGPIDQADEPL